MFTLFGVEDSFFCNSRVINNQRKLHATWLQRKLLASNNEVTELLASNDEVTESYAHILTDG